MLVLLFMLVLMLVLMLMFMLVLVLVLRLVFTLVFVFAFVFVFALVFALPLLSGLAGIKGSGHLGVLVGAVGLQPGRYGCDLHFEYLAAFDAELVATLIGQMLSYTHVRAVLHWPHLLHVGSGLVAV